MPKFPRIIPPPKVVKPCKLLKPCVKCGKGLGHCNGGWCQRCVDTWIQETTPQHNTCQANEMLGRKAVPGTHARKFD